jgi:hypothetical protein
MAENLEGNQSQPATNPQPAVVGPKVPSRG